MRRIAMLRRTALAAAVAVVGFAAFVPGAGPLATQPAAAAPQPAAAGSPRSPIKHIVFIAKENRSFDHYFGAFPDPGNHLNQSTTAKCYRKTDPSTADTFTMQRAPDPMPQDVAHANSTWKQAYHGGAMDGFCHENGAIVKATGQDIADTQMQAGDIPNYWSYAKKYGIGDRMFASWRGASFGNNVFAVASQTGRYSTILNRRAIYGNPQDPISGSHTWGCNNHAGTKVSMINMSGGLSDVFPCFGFKALPNLLDDAGLDWKYYASQDGSHFVHSGIAAIKSIRCPPGDQPPCRSDYPYWDRHVQGGSQILTDAANGTLPAVSWFLAKATEHPPKTACDGENSTVNAVNALMQGPDWDSTAIVVWWDEWGGFYDHVKPPTGVGVDDGVRGLNKLISYGFRVPLLVISPWVRRGPLQNNGYVSHTFYSHASFTRFVEWAFRLPTLGAADDLSKYTAREPKPGNLTDFFDFSSSTPPKGKLLLSTRACPALNAAQKAYIRTWNDD